MDCSECGIFNFSSRAIHSVKAHIRQVRSLRMVTDTCFPPHKCAEMMHEHVGDLQTMESPAGWPQPLRSSNEIFTFYWHWTLASIHGAQWVKAARWSFWWGLPIPISTYITGMSTGHKWKKKNAIPSKCSLVNYLVIFVLSRKRLWLFVVEWMRRGRKRFNHHAILSHPIEIVHL